MRLLACVGWWSDVPPFGVASSSSEHALDSFVLSFRLPQSGAISVVETQRYAGPKISGKIK